MASIFRISIVRDDEEPVLLHPGAKGERDLVDAITRQVVDKGVGFFRTEAHVRQAIVDGVSEILHALKSEVIPS